MTILTIDNMAGKNLPDYESYKIDRRIYRTYEDLLEAVDDCMNENVFMITVTVDGEEIIRKYQ